MFNENKKEKKNKPILQKASDNKIKIGLISEPSYMVRSEFNTYLTIEER